MGTRDGWIQLDGAGPPVLELPGDDVAPAVYRTRGRSEDEAIRLLHSCERVEQAGHGACTVIAIDREGSTLAPLPWRWPRRRIRLC